MTFTPMQRNRVPEGKPWVKLRCSHRDGVADQITVTISATFATFLQVGDGTKVMCERGSGADLGHMLVYPHKGKGSFICSTGNVAPGNVRFCFNAGYLLTEGKHPSTKSPNVIPLAGVTKRSRRLLDIELPFWAYPQWDPLEMLETATESEVEV